MEVLSYSVSNERLDVPDELAADSSGMMLLPIVSEYKKLVEIIVVYRMLDLQPTKRPSAVDLVAIFSSVDEQPKQNISPVQISSVHGISLHTCTYYLDGLHVHRGSEGTRITQNRCLSGPRLCLFSNPNPCCGKW
jgi:hypothetical protein